MATEISHPAMWRSLAESDPEMAAHQHAFFGRRFETETLTGDAARPRRGRKRSSAQAVLAELAVGFEPTT